jgi:hypothetical protein
MCYDFVVVLLVELHIGWDNPIPNADYIRQNKHNRRRNTVFLLLCFLRKHLTDEYASLTCYYIEITRSS